MKLLKVSKAHVFEALLYGAIIVLALGYFPLGVLFPRATSKPQSPGAAYRVGLAREYAASLRIGADKLSAGTPLPQVLGDIGADYAQRRGDLFDGVLAPVLNQIVPEGTPDSQVTQPQRRAMADALRTIATQLENP